MEPNNNINNNNNINKNNNNNNNILNESGGMGGVEEIGPNEILTPPISKNSLEKYTDGHYAKLTHGWTHYQLFEPYKDMEGDGKLKPKLVKNLSESFSQSKKKSKVVLCLHGLSWWAMAFHPLVQPLIENEYTVLLFDFYGRGRSDSPNEIAYTLDILLNQAIDLLDHLNIDNIYLVGYSMGGAVATLFAATHPQRLIKVVGLGPAIVPVPVPLIGRLVTMPYIGIFIFRFFGAQTMLKRVENERFSNDISDYSSIEPSVIDDLVEKTKWMINVKPNYLYAFHSTLCNIQFEQGLVHLFPQIPKTLPILIILGTKDKVIPFEISINTFKQHFPHTRVESVDCGHSLTLERPNQVSDLLIQFLKEPL
ncbi:hypothetical protein DDB_G0292774 [Dictyostelium discoideum AX4]|uniref:AB hydrolase-1 domain-containing protein n=1 Tax=Dictyostelium discoideum TaxID=44689 RepID=Q54CT5_DICDI|nr:hypothetical protein DDB_G0292774 [Dictyostelium discoideum AX4]EAL61061.1 hypothetical protein DDB_G0292774 [Dictyostelium discoideum AX4]|eukprot:XP_629456.1 hypothetical protein DDB_G0292774 [Dictyostelium discoideum AX4]